MEVHDSDDETYNCDDVYTVSSDDESIDPLNVWDEDPNGLKDNDKLLN